MYEHRLQPPLSRFQFILRLWRHVAFLVLLLAVSLALGMAGYEHFEKLPWRDAFENAAMLLGGMGQVDTPKTPAGKLFAGIYALYAGLLFIVGTGILLAPVVHRVMHRFHWENRER